MMETLGFCGIENGITYSVHEDDGEYIATINNHKEVETKKFPKASTAKKWVNRMLDDSKGKNESDRFT